MSPTPLQPPDSPDQDPRLPELLEACLRAERAAPGSSAELVRAAPEGLRDELAQLIALARVLETAPWAGATPRLRAGAPPRPQRQSQPVTRRSGPARRPRRGAPWVPRAVAIVAALVLSGYGSVLASAGALPGEPLYRVKQANEVVMLELSRDDMTRALVLLRQAGTRLEEAMRLARAGQVRSAGEVLQQYVATLGRATASLRQARGSSNPQARAEFEAELQHQRDRLQALAREAPQPLRPSIQEAQVAVSRDLGSSPDASGVGPGRPTPSATPAAVPATSPIPAASPSVGAPVRPSASPSPASSPVGQATPVQEADTSRR